MGAVLVYDGGGNHTRDNDNRGITIAWPWLRQDKLI
jgi:hypothetical protein